MSGRHPPARRGQRHRPRQQQQRRRRRRHGNLLTVHCDGGDACGASAFEFLSGFDGNKEQCSAHAAVRKRWISVSGAGRKNSSCVRQQRGRGGAGGCGQGRLHACILCDWGGLSPLSAANHDVVSRTEETVFVSGRHPPARRGRRHRPRQQQQQQRRRRAPQSQHQRPHRHSLHRRAHRRPLHRRPHRRHQRRPHLRPLHRRSHTATLTTASSLTTSSSTAAAVAATAAVTAASTAAPKRGRAFARSLATLAPSALHPRSLSLTATTLTLAPSALGPSPLPQPPSTLRTFTEQQRAEQAAVQAAARAHKELSRHI